MNSSHISPRTCEYLDMQGFTTLSPRQKAEITFGLRFTPALCNVAVLAGMVFASWKIFAVLAVFGALGTFTRNLHPFDLLYNYLIRHVVHKPKLPPTPAPKRFACALGMIFLIAGALAYFLSFAMLGHLFGIFYILSAGLMAVTHFCIGSWLYRKLYTQTDRPKMI